MVLQLRVVARGRHSTRYAVLGITNSKGLSRKASLMSASPLAQREFISSAYYGKRLMLGEFERQAGRAGAARRGTGPSTYGPRHRVILLSRSESSILVQLSPGELDGTPQHCRNLKGWGMLKKRKAGGMNQGSVEPTAAAGLFNNNEDFNHCRPAATESGYTFFIEQWCAAAVNGVLSYHNGIRSITVLSCH